MNRLFFAGRCEGCILSEYLELRTEEIESSNQLQSFGVGYSVLAASSITASVCNLRNPGPTLLLGKGLSLAHLNKVTAYFHIIAYKHSTNAIDKLDVEEAVIENVPACRSSCLHYLTLRK